MQAWLQMVEIYYPSNFMSYEQIKGDTVKSKSTKAFGLNIQLTIYTDFCSFAWFIHLSKDWQEITTRVVRYCISRDRNKLEKQATHNSLWVKPKWIYIKSEHSSLQNSLNKEELPQQAQGIFDSTQLIYCTTHVLVVAGSSQVHW